MKVCVKVPITGYVRDPISFTVDQLVPRIHADVGDTLTVILNNNSHYICDSMYFPGTHIAVFPSQCSQIIKEAALKPQEEEEHDIEKYYNVYEKPIKKQESLDDPFYTAFESEDSD